MLHQTAEPAPAAPRWKMPLTVVLVGLAAVGAALWLLWSQSPVRQPVALPTIAPEPRAPRELKVHVTGAVAAPGVYALADGARVSDLLQRAGGPAEGADVARLNLAAPLRDGQQVVVPQQGSGQTAGPAAAPT